MSRDAAADGARLLQPGRNCWKLERATRFRCVQDGEDYFRLVRTAILAAQRSVFILGWDIAAGIDLLPGAPPSAEPTRLKELLDFAARRRPGLHCFVLIWDYAAFYALERDPFSRARLGWGSHRRVHFRYDAQHPLGASHHQKVVVVDDCLALVGGIDLTGHRWDTTEHRVEQPLRLNPFGAPYAPYHEVAALVEGPVAASLGELARERWRRRGSPHMPRVEPGPGGCWPADVAPDLSDVDVAIARTEPAFGGRPAVRECEALFFASIAAARRSVYIENQYFTNPQLGAALAARLREERGPEVIVVGPKDCEGWLEHRTMGALRWKLLAELQAADLHGRLRLRYPLASRAAGVCTFVHSKVMIVDDELLRIGSANLSSRSMGLDTECDLAVAAGGDPARSAAIAGVRSRLLAEHLGASPADVERAIAREGSLRAALDALAHGDRTLEPIRADVDGTDDPGEFVRGAADPEEPSRLSLTVDRLLPDIEAQDQRGRRLVFVLPAAALALLLLVAWRSTGLLPWLSLRGLQEILASAPESPTAFPLALGLLLAGGLLLLPLELLVVPAVVVFGPLLGGPLAAAATLGSALLGYAAGRTLSLRRVQPLVGRRAARLWRLVRGSGFLTVAVMRVAAVAPGTSIDLLCGAARLPLHEYVNGTLLGLLPALLALGTLAGFLRHAILHPGLGSAALTAGLAVALALLVLRLRTSLLLRRMAPTVQEHRERTLFG